MIDFEKDFYGKFKVINDKTRFAGIVSLGGTNKIIGPGIIYDNYGAFRKYKFVEGYQNGKPHGLYFRHNDNTDFTEVGILNEGTYNGPFFNRLKDTGAFGYCDTNSEELGFYVKFINNGSDFIVFQLNDGKALNRCLISKSYKLYKGSCSDLDHYKIISDESITLDYQTHMPLTWLTPSNSLQAPSDIKSYPFYQVVQNGEIVNKYDQKQVHIFDYSNKPLWTMVKSKESLIFGEASHNKLSGLRCCRYSGDKMVLGKYNDTYAILLTIDHNRNDELFALQSFENNKPDGPRFAVHEDFLSIQTFKNGSQNNKIVLIYKNTLDVVVSSLNGDYLGGIIYDKVDIPKNTETIQVLNGYHKKTYSNGYYEGNFVNGKRHGTGTYVFNDGCKYVGEFNNNVREGYATYYYKDGSRFEGYFKNGIRHGKGTYYDISGMKYDGEYYDDARHGKGLLYEVDGTCKELYYDKGTLLEEKIAIQKLTFNNGYYEGELKNGRIHGKGTYIWNSGDKYVGEWDNGNFNGFGTYYYSNGDRYEGQWQNDKKHGKGTYYYKDGSVTRGNWENNKYVIEKPVKGKDKDHLGEYEGTFLHGVRHGMGTLTRGDGSKLTGMWINGKLTGTAIANLKDGRKFIETYKDGLLIETHEKIEEIITSDGDKYVGTLRKGKYHGKGTLIYSSGSKYEGEFVDGLPHGYGTLYYKNKDKYIGNFYRGWLENDGTLYYKNGDKLIGKWHDNQFGNVGTYKFNNGNVYEGEFKNQLFHGEGKVKYKDGSFFEGRFKDGKACGLGTMNYKDGSCIHGIYEENQVIEVRYKFGDIEYTLKDFPISKKIVINEKEDPYKEILKDYEYQVIGTDVIITKFKNPTKKIVIPSCVTKIGKYAAYNSENRNVIEQVTLSDNIWRIEEGAFFDCNNLILVNFGKDIKVIEKRAFYNTNLQGVDIPKTLLEIKEEAFISFDQSKMAFGVVPSNVKVASNAFSKNWKRFG